MPDSPDMHADTAAPLPATMKNINAQLTCMAYSIHSATGESMSFEHRKTRALELLQATGMMRSHYAPPLIRLLWKAGVQIAPPHFQSFQSAALLTGSWFGFFMGVFMGLFGWFQGAATLHSAWIAVAVACVAGLLFGIAMASVYARDRRKHQLPAWTALDEQR